MEIIESLKKSIIGSYIEITIHLKLDSERGICENGIL